MRSLFPSAGHKDILQYFLLIAYRGRGDISLVFLLAECSSFMNPRPTWRVEGFVFFPLKDRISQQEGN